MVEEDRFFHPDIESIYRQIHEGEIVMLVEKAIGEMEF
jgi:histidine ammonia-lyase